MFQFIKNKRPTAKNMSGSLGGILKGNIVNLEGWDLKLGGLKIQRVAIFNYVSVTKYKRGERFERFI